MRIYLDNAATSDPKPAPVIKAVLSALADANANPGRSGHPPAVEAARRVLRAREAVARALGANDPMNVAFAMNCTDAINLAIKGAVKPGDHVVSTTLEHNSVLRVLGEMRARGEIEFTLVSPSGFFVEPGDIRRAARKNTRLIIATHASNVTGAMQPAREICDVARSLGILSLIDGAQALGCAKVNVADLGCSMYAFPGHKGLLGPMGTGGLYIAGDADIRPLREGGTGSSSTSILQPRERPERYEAGTVNLPGIAGLGAGAEYVNARLNEIMSRERETAGALYEGLRKMPGITLYSPPGAGIASFNKGDYESARLADALSEAGVFARGGLHCAPLAHKLLGTGERGAVRLSVGHATTLMEIEAALAAIRAA